MDEPGTAACSPLAGPLAVFFSHPSVFVLAGTAAGGLFLGSGARRDHRGSAASWPPTRYGSPAFAIVYVVAVRDLEGASADCEQRRRGASGRYEEPLLDLQRAGWDAANGRGARCRAWSSSAPCTSGAAALASSGPRRGRIRRAPGRRARGGVPGRPAVPDLPAARRRSVPRRGGLAVLGARPAARRCCSVAAAIGLIVAARGGNRRVAPGRPTGLEEIEPLLAEVADAGATATCSSSIPESQYAFRYYRSATTAARSPGHAPAVAFTPTAWRASADTRRRSSPDSPGLIVGAGTTEVGPRRLGAAREGLVPRHARLPEDGGRGARRRRPSGEAQIGLLARRRIAALPLRPR